MKDSLNSIVLYNFQEFHTHAFIYHSNHFKKFPTPTLPLPLPSPHW